MLNAHNAADARMPRGNVIHDFEAPSSRSIAIALAAYRPNIGYFAEQLASIRAQSYPAWRCIVTLDSPLAELAGERSLVEYFNDARYEWHENGGRLGFKRNFERAIQIACRRGAWAIATCDQDDVWYSDKLATLAKVLAAGPPLSLVHSDMHILDERGVRVDTVWQSTRQVVTEATPADLLIWNFVAGSSMLLDANLARRYPSIPESFTYHDHWYALAASCHGGVHGVKRALVAYRQHGGNVHGARPFDWRVRVPTPRRLTTELASMRDAWRLLRRRTSDALAEGMPLSRGLVLRYVNGADLGLSLLGRGVVRTVSNPWLSRCLIYNAIGRMVDLVRP